MTHKQEQILGDFRSFVEKRNKTVLILCAVIFVFYYSFSLGVGLFPEVLGYKLGPSSITLGIMWGVFLIVLSIVITGIYTLIANYFFDREQGELLEKLRSENLLEPLKSGELAYRSCGCEKSGCERQGGEK